MKAEEFDRRFDESEDVSEFLELSHASRPAYKQNRVVATLMIEAIDREAKRLGVTRQSIVKAWIAERLERHST